jgi:hypothetical protein
MSVDSICFFSNLSETSIPKAFLEVKAIFLSQKTRIDDSTNTRFAGSLKHYTP